MLKKKRKEKKRKEKKRNEMKRKQKKKTKSKEKRRKRKKEKKRKEKKRKYIHSRTALRGSWSLGMVIGVEIISWDFRGEVRPCLFTARLLFTFAFPEELLFVEELLF